MPLGASVILLWLALACRRPAPAQVPVEMPTFGRPTAGAEPVRTAVVGPTTWIGAGLIVRVPEGYRGEAGAVVERLVVRLVHEGTRGELSIEAWAPDEAIVAPAGCAPLYEGRRGWRDLAGLGPSELLTCVREDATAPIETRWVVREPSRTLVLTLLVPPGRAFEARRALDLLLDSVTRTQVSGGDGG